MAALDLPAALHALHDREWDRLGRAGTWFGAADRIAIAEAARGGAADTPACRAARAIYAEPSAIRRDWLAGWEADGLTLTEYVEVLGISARLRALDTLTFGTGHPVRPLPRPQAGEPSRESVDAALDGAWVPTVGVAFPPTILSSVPAENDAMHDVNGELYLTPTIEQNGYSMGNMSVVRDGLTRTQIEFVASRTSLLNDCFY